MNIEPENTIKNQGSKELALGGVGLFLVINCLLAYAEAPIANTMCKGCGENTNGIYTVPFTLCCLYLFFISYRLLFNRDQHISGWAIMLALPMMYILHFLGAAMLVGAMEEYALCIYIAILAIANRKGLNLTLKTVLLTAAITIGMILAIGSHICPKWWRNGHHTNLINGGRTIIDYHCGCGEKKTGTTRYYDANSHQPIQIKKEDNIKPGDTVYWELKSDGQMATLEKDTLINGSLIPISYKTQIYPGGGIMLRTRFAPDLTEERLYSRNGAVRIFILRDKAGMRSYLYDSITGQPIDSALGDPPYSLWLK